jgi:glycosyltransferase involved in cell wall biosynthesis
VEAMAAGTSVISTRVDSIRRIIEDGSCGYLIDYGDAGARREDRPVAQR